MKSNEELNAALLAITNAVQERGGTFVAAMQVGDMVSDNQCGHILNMFGLLKLLGRRADNNMTKVIIKEPNHDD